VVPSLRGVGALLGDLSRRFFESFRKQMTEDSRPGVSALVLEMSLPVLPLGWHGRVVLQGVGVGIREEWEILAEAFAIT
jgi:hypothetical protein